MTCTCACPAPTKHHRPLPLGRTGRRRRDHLELRGAPPSREHRRNGGGPGVHPRRPPPVGVAKLVRVVAPADHPELQVADGVPGGWVSPCRAGPALRVPTAPLRTDSVPVWVWVSVYAWPRVQAQAQAGMDRTLAPLRGCGSGEGGGVVNLDDVTICTKGHRERLWHAAGTAG